MHEHIENSVGKEYDAWATEGQCVLDFLVITVSLTYNHSNSSSLLLSIFSGILESYWGEHIHLGYYNDEERAKGYKKKDFIQAKYDFIDEMMKFGKIGSPKTILDVGCGIGG